MNIFLFQSRRNDDKALCDVDKITCIKLFYFSFYNTLRYNCRSWNSWIAEPCCAFLEAETSNSIRLDGSVYLMEAELDFPVQLFPQASCMVLAILGFSIHRSLLPNHCFCCHSSYSDSGDESISHNSSFPL